MASNHSSIIKIVEVHPGAAIGTRIGKERLQLAREYKRDIDSRIAIVNWFDEIGLKGIPHDVSETSHQVDACGAALAAWHWVDPTKQPTWQWKTTTPTHPFEFCC